MIYVAENLKEIEVWINIGVKDGVVKFEDTSFISTGIDCPLAGVYFADVGTMGTNIWPS